MSKVRKLHDDEVDIDASLVARLLAEQFPSWAGLSIRIPRISRVLVDTEPEDE